MFKKSKALVLAVVLTMALPTAAFGALLPTDAHYGGAEVVAQPDGTEIQYYEDVYGKIYTDLTKVLRTVIPGENGSNTIKYDANIISHEGAPWLDHKVTNEGASLTVTNVLRESVHNNQRLLYAKAPVSLTFSGDYLNCRAITDYTRFYVEQGRVVYSIGLDKRTLKTYATEKLDISEAVQTKTLSKPGMYGINFDYDLGTGVHTYIYVTDGTEDVSYVAPTAETATGLPEKITVDGKEFNSSVYNIAGANYLQARDLAYMLNGTAKQFDLVYAKQWDLDTIKTYSSPAYTPVGGEMATVASGTKTATPTARIMKLDGLEINPLIYAIDGSNYVKLTDLAKIIDFGLASDSSTNTISINTTTGYSEVGSPPIPASPTIKVGDTTRLAGNDRYQTAVAISQSGWPHSDAVVLADGNTYQDALVGSSFAYLKDAPMLLTPSAELNSDTSAEISRLGAKTVYILGSTKSVSQAVEDALKQQYTVIRIGGADVFETAVQVGTAVGKLKKFDTVALATYINFPDALAMAPFSAKNTMPILFSGVNGLGYDTQSALQAWGVKNVIIAGGTGIISSAVESQLTGMGIKVTRLAGYDRYDTSLEILKYFAPQGGYPTISIATGELYPDALTGAVLAAKNNTPLVLVEKNTVKSSIADYLSGNTINKAYIFGGTAVVSTKLTGK